MTKTIVGVPAVVKPRHNFRDIVRNGYHYRLPSVRVIPQFPLPRSLWTNHHPPYLSGRPRVAPPFFSSRRFCKFFRRRSTTRYTDSMSFHSVLRNNNLLTPRATFAGRPRFIRTWAVARGGGGAIRSSDGVGTPPTCVRQWPGADRIRGSRSTRCTCRNRSPRCADRGKSHPPGTCVRKRRRPGNWRR